MDEVAELANLCADAWPALTDEPLGQWRLRAADGFTGRANSALATGNPGLPVSDALHRALEFAGRQGISPLAQVTVGAAAEQGVAAAGWLVDLARPGGSESIVLTSRLADMCTPGHRAVVLETPSPQWWELTTGGSSRPPAAQRHVLATGDKLGFGLVEGAGSVRGAVVGDFLHIARLAIRPEFRREGLATQLLSALGEWAAGHGATRCVLQVAEHNAAALRLYAGLGCVEHHRYRYWRPGPSSQRFFLPA